MNPDYNASEAASYLQLKTIYIEEADWQLTLLVAVECLIRVVLETKS